MEFFNDIVCTREPSLVPSDIFIFLSEAFLPEASSQILQGVFQVKLKSLRGLFWDMK